MTESISVKLQSILDENKQSLTDNFYKTLSDLNLQINNEEHNNLYVVKYFTSKLIRIDYNLYQTKITSHSQILTLNSEQYEFIKRNTENGEFVNLCCSIVLEDIEKKLCVDLSQNQIPVERSTCFCHNSDEEDEDTFIEPASSIAIKPCIKITHVKKYK